MTQATERNGKYKWEMNEKERATLTGIDLVHIIEQYNLYDCIVEAFKDDKLGADVIRLTDDCALNVFIFAYHDEKSPVEVEYHNEYKEEEIFEVTRKGGE